MRKIGLLVLLGIFAGVTAEGVILFRTGDPSANTTAPTPDPAGSGWNYEGIYGGFPGTPIAPHFFLTAQHFGTQGNIFTFQSVTYHVVANFPDPNGDLILYQVLETFPTFAPVYSGLNEVGQRIVDIGRGTQRGSEYYLNATLRGWLWGASDGVQRWGENIVTSIVPYGTDNELLYATFDQNGLPDECTLSSGDSGGGAFINDNGTWKLCGVNYGVDGDFYTDGNGDGQFIAALFDMRDLWVQNDTPPPNYIQITGSNPVPSGFYPTRVSRRLPWVCSVVAAPVVGREDNFVTLTYTKLAVYPDIAYIVEQSSDLMTWGPATTIDEVIWSSGGVEIIEAKVDIGNATALFLRLRTTRP